MRTTNLIQSYLNNSQATRQYNADKAVKDFDVKKELSNRTFIKPLPSNGKLVRTGPMDILSETKKNFKYDFNAFRHAVKGEANDHELGRLNDVGMKLGGLAIASYLFTKKQTPMTKLFEFVGLASFFGAMDIWPKLFIQLPAWLIHGVNVRQQYEDSFGRKKMFYQDHQFIPWDLYQEDEINKIGDRLGVPKNIPNRREYIQEKMRKIALQNNTMWMLTAGFATPLMSALICNRLEKPIAKYMDQRMDKKANSLLTNFSQEIKKYDFSKNNEALAKILDGNIGKTITPELVEEISLNMTNGLDHMVAVGLEKDLDKLLVSENRYHISSETLDNVRNVLKDAFSEVNLNPEQLEKLLPDNASIIDAFSNKNLLNGEVKEFSDHTKAITNLMESRIQELVKDNPDGLLAKQLNFAFNEFLHSSGHNVDSILVGAFKSSPTAILTEQAANTLKEVSGFLNKLKAEKIVLDRYQYIKVAQAPETGLANSWNEINESFLKIMKFTPEEIQKGRIDGEIAGEVLRNKLETIAADRQSYAAFVDEMQKLLSSLHSKMATLDMTQDESINLYKALVNSSFDGAAGNLWQKGMTNTVEALTGFADTSKTSSKDLMFDFVTSRFEGVKNSFYRMLDAADVFYKVAHVEGLDHVLTPQVLKETKEEIVELGKSILINGHASDYSVKFWQLRNAEPNTSDYGQITSRNGKVVNEYFGKADEAKLIEYSNDRLYFDKVMKFMFGGDIHQDTDVKIKNSVFYEDFKNYRRKVLDFLGGEHYFVKNNFLVDGKRVDSSSEFKFLLSGCPLNEMFSKIFNNSFNSKAWFSMFGKLGAGLVGVTLLSQFFIGRTKKPQQSKEVK